MHGRSCEMRGKTRVGLPSIYAISETLEIRNAPAKSSQSRAFERKFLGGANEREKKTTMPPRGEEEKRRERGETPREAEFRRAKVKPGLDTTRLPPLRSARPCNINIRETADAAHVGTWLGRGQGRKALGNVTRDRGSRNRGRDGSVRGLEVVDSARNTDGSSVRHQYPSNVRSYLKIQWFANNEWQINFVSFAERRKLVRYKWIKRARREKRGSTRDFMEVPRFHKSSVSHDPSLDHCENSLWKSRSNTINAIKMRSTQYCDVLFFFFFARLLFNLPEEAKGFSLSLSLARRNAMRARLCVPLFYNWFPRVRLLSLDQWRNSQG